MGIYRAFKPWLGGKKQKGLMAEKAEMVEMAETEVTEETVESVESGVGIADREGCLMR